MTLSTFRNNNGFRHFCTLLAAACSILALAAVAGAAPAQARQKRFATPEEAVTSLVAATRDNDEKALVTILGPASSALVTSGDPVKDKADRERFVALFEEQHRIERSGSARALLHIGGKDYPLPIPIVKKGTAWVFDAKAGKEEILNRRIGKNELAVIEILHAYLDAQREYAAKDRNGDGALEFAPKILSTPGKHDGLYWEAKEGEEASPLGPLIARAATEGYASANAGDTAPYHGYYFRILKSQGKDAVGGAYDYIINGKMVLGFGLLAYPAAYGSSGIMTFIVNQGGVVYQKNLGKNTAKAAAAMTHFNPDQSWKKVE